MQATDEAAIRRHFLIQSDACESLGSPFTASVCRVLAKVLDETTGDRPTRAVVARQPARRRALTALLRRPARAGAVRRRSCSRFRLSAACQGRGKSRRHHRRCDRAQRARLGQAMDSSPQTNEIARSAMLLPGFLAIAREAGLPLDICEIGSSAGLNLLFDRFAYDFDGNGWGDRTRRCGSRLKSAAARPASTATSPSPAGPAAT